MDHTHIVYALNLDHFANTRDSQAVVPELVYQLVRLSGPAICRIPYGDGINQPGWDGLVECDNPKLRFVPAGKSFWEIGTDARPEEKATKEFDKRSKAMTTKQMNESTFVFVTPRSAASGRWEEKDQTKWIQDREGSAWKKIVVIDGTGLADWMREYPAVGQWMAKRIGISPTLGGIVTPRDHWEIISTQVTDGDPPLPPKLFLNARDAACEHLQKAFTAGPSTCLIFAEGRDDVHDFVAAYLASLPDPDGATLSNRCLFIAEEDAWRSVCTTRGPHVLVSFPKLELEGDGSDLILLAKKHGHSVVVPLSTAMGFGGDMIQLRSPLARNIEAELKAGGFAEERARELGRISDGRLSTLRRHFKGLGTVPPYATWGNADELARAGLIGKWDGANRNDTKALEILLGKSYGEWIETIRGDSLRSDSPLSQRNEQWRVAGRSEAWIALGCRLTDEDLSRFTAFALEVLEEVDPALDLHIDERNMASMLGKRPRFSQRLRVGVAESIALLGARPSHLSSCSLGKPQSIASDIVRKLLDNADWKRWASLDRLLPLLAEAAPTTFLSAVENALADPLKSPFGEVFSQAGSSLMGPGSYHCGLLWALEGLAWDAAFLGSSAMLLAELAAIDPGGNLANRPKNSLRDIFLPWYPQTCASVPARTASVKAIASEHLDVGWKLLISLLPGRHGSTSGTHRPTWRTIDLPANPGTMPRAEYIEQCLSYINLAVDIALKDDARLVELLDSYNEFPPEAKNKLLEILSSADRQSLNPEGRASIWEKLISLIRRHRSYSDADWTMDEAELQAIDAVASKLRPENLLLRHRHLFATDDFDLHDDQGEYKDQAERLALTRQQAVSDIVAAHGLDALMQFASSSSAPHVVGSTYASIVDSDDSELILPGTLLSEHHQTQQFVAGYVWSRFRQHGWEWADAVLSKGWVLEKKARFLQLLPFVSETWDRSEAALGEDVGRLYWSKVQVNPYACESSRNRAANMLLANQRPIAALSVLSEAARRDEDFDATLASTVLIEAAQSADEKQRIDSYRTIKLISALQDAPEADRAILLRIEWLYLPLLDRHSNGSPRTLEAQLATNPEFFCELIAAVFRSEFDGENDKEIDEGRKQLAQTGYRLLMEWSTCPGSDDTGGFDADAFAKWVSDVEDATKGSGYWGVAQSKIGQVLTHAPPGADDLWIHPAVATVLNRRDTDEMRTGFTVALFNQRGVHRFTAGKEELQLAADNRQKAAVLERCGYMRFAAAMRTFAENYERDAQREAERDLDGDLYSEQ